MALASARVSRVYLFFGMPVHSFILQDLRSRAGGPPKASLLHVRFSHNLFGYRDNRQHYARRVGGIVKHPDICFSHLHAAHLRLPALQIA